jgi:hypothetical protein
MYALLGTAWARTSDVRIGPHCRVFTVPESHTEGSSSLSNPLSRSIASRQSSGQCAQLTAASALRSLSTPSSNSPRSDTVHTLPFDAIARGTWLECTLWAQHATLRSGIWERRRQSEVIPEFRLNRAARSLVHSAGHWYRHPNAFLQYRLLLMLQYYYCTS